MLKRKIIKQLENWKNKEKKKPLVLYGQRQAGKTYACRMLGKEYSSYIELNFLETPSLRNIFTGDLDITTLIQNISFISNYKFIPHETLIVFDEIQECPQAITSLKFWCEDGRFDVIGTGSALGMNYDNNQSYPVGYVEYLKMYPLDFEEFLWANSIDEDQIASLKNCFDHFEKVPSFIHDKMMHLLRLYMVLGGMPEVVQKYISTNNLSEADSVQKQIYLGYINDIARFADPNIKIKAEKCFKSIPLQLSKENHKFQYKEVEHNGTARKFESSIDWLENAYFVKQVNLVTSLSYPLHSVENNFRIYTSDIGLLIAYYDFQLKNAILNDRSFSSSNSNIILKSTKGGLYEALVADMLIKKGYEHLYFYKPTESLEIEFLIENKDGVIPIEVKAGRAKAISLNTVLENPDIAYGYKFCSQNVGKEGKKITMPLYMLMFL